MKEIIIISLLIIISYLLGAIPSSVWLGKWLYDTDVREHGSGNAGFTNALRVLGLKVGIPVLVVDVFKGFLAVKLIGFFSLYNPGSTPFINMQVLCGTVAVIGHIFPVYAKFNGGKGVATLFGVILAIAPYPTLIALGVFIITLLISNYVSLSSLMAGLSFPLSLIFIFNTEKTSLIIFSVMIFILLILTHQKNIGRLIRNEENKTHLIKNQKNNEEE